MKLLLFPWAKSVVIGFVQHWLLSAHCFPDGNEFIIRYMSVWGLAYALEYIRRGIQWYMEILLRGKKKRIKRLLEFRKRLNIPEVLLIIF